MKYQKMCQEILNAIGKDNIQDVFYCITRLRFILKDNSIVDKKALEKIEGIIQVKEVGNQLQLVIGSHVQAVYSDFCELSGISQNEIVPDDSPVATKASGASFGSKVLETLSSIFLPVMPAFVTGGMLKSLVVLLTTFKLIAGDNGIAVMLNIIGDVPFYFLPFMVGATTAKRFKLNEIFGIMIAGCLLYPTIMNQTAGTSIAYFFLNVPAYNYASSVLPTVLSVIAFSYLYRMIDRFIPNNLKIVFSGMLSFAIFMPILMTLVAPLGNYLGQLLSSVTVALFNTTGPIAGALFAGFMPFIIMAGMHTALAPIMIQNFATLGYDFLMPAFFINNIAVAGSTLGASFKIRNKKMKTAAISSGGLGIIGITEPALYSIDIKYKQPLVGAIVGGAVGGALYVILGVKCYVYSMPGIFSLAGYLDSGSNLIMIIVCLLAAFVSAFAYSFIMTKDNESEM